MQILQISLITFLFLLSTFDTVIPVTPILQSFCRNSSNFSRLVTIVIIVYFFFTNCVLPVIFHILILSSKNLRELGINDKSNFHIMAEKSLRDGAGNTYFPLSLEDILEILDNAY